LASRLAGRGASLPEAFNLAKKGAELEPGNPSYQFGLAQVLARAHKYDQAQLVANRLAANALDPHSKENAAQLLDYVQRLKEAEATYGSRALNSALTNNVRADSKAESSNGSADSNDEETEEPENSANDGKTRIDGMITDVQCKAQDMTITLSTPSGTVKLRAPDNSKVDYISDLPLQTEVFWPCTALNGHTVHVKYLPAAATSKQAYAGELTDVEIRK
jgi:hypothetical protein